MCIAVPLEIRELLPHGRAIAARGELDVEIDVSLLDSLSVGDWVIVHAGFAIGRVEAEEAERTIRDMQGFMDD